MPIWSFRTNQFRRHVRRTGFVFTSAAAPVVAPELSWLGIYPDQIDALPRIEAALHPSLSFVVPVPDLPIPELSWLGVYPEQIYDLARTEPSLQPNVFNLQPTPDIGWQAIYPAEVYEPEINDAALHPDLSLTIPVADLPIPELSWAAIYPEQIYGLPRIESALHESLFFTNALPDFPVPDLSWRVVYPDEVYALPRIESTLHEFIFLTFAIPDFPVPDLSWKAVYPEETYSLPRIESALHPPLFFVEPISQIEEIWWRGVYPDELHDLSRTDYLHQNVFLLSSLQDLAWQAIYPNEVYEIDRNEAALQPIPEIPFVQAVAPEPFLEWFIENVLPVPLPEFRVDDISFVIPLPDLPVPDLPRFAVYPDEVYEFPRIESSLHEWLFYDYVFNVATPAPELSWLANYPEILHQPPTITPGWFELPLLFIEPPIPPEPEAPGGDQVAGGTRGRARRGRPILQPPIIRMRPILLQIVLELESPFRPQILGGIVPLPEVQFAAQTETGVLDRPLRTIPMMDLDIAAFTEVQTERVDTFYYRDALTGLLNKRQQEYNDELERLRGEFEDMVVLGILDTTREET